MVSFLLQNPATAQVEKAFKARKQPIEDELWVMQNRIHDAKTNRKGGLVLLKFFFFQVGLIKTPFGVIYIYICFIFLYRVLKHVLSEGKGCWFLQVSLFILWLF